RFNSSPSLIDSQTPFIRGQLTTLTQCCGAIAITTQTSLLSAIGITTQNSLIIVNCIDILWRLWNSGMV
ncbi:MAG: hypothetical protein JAY72_10235, partial [Candidatus Thiodiazotropha endolucinida]|nr:hypothetical protein [Candidatus Thiodiazotropha taylori]MCW4322053.1 hypothetical protein [Candidatus Thiodiazotropha taylori]